MSLHNTVQSTSPATFNIDRFQDFGSQLSRPMRVTSGTVIPFPETYEKTWPIADFSPLIASLGFLVYQYTSANAPNLDLWTPPFFQGGINLSLYEKLRGIFIAAQDESFERGMDSVFSRKLVAYIRQFGYEALEFIQELIDDDLINTEVVSEALKWIGHIDDPQTAEQRRWILEKNLSHVSFQARDGALLGLASMDNPASIPILEAAIEKERIPELREDMRQVLEQLVKTAEE